MTEDIRWKQCFNNYLSALPTLTEAVALAQQRPLSKLEQQGLIQGFEFTHELAWNVLKDYLDAQGFVGLIGSKNATRQAFKDALIQDGDAWMDMIKARKPIPTHEIRAAQAHGGSNLRRAGAIPCGRPGRVVRVTCQGKLQTRFRH